ncbi:AAA family ATPase [Myceligenerans xiligouense]|uniref:MinD-like ATPase involved in chromosome partitioning or flagellar assembly n=1 Tax=Myceligenerans xiligouense TaxID=253184 RepID=A0A3N4ZL84_9MICO|nr:AAA family ATPase [Myceligenerans xiligouense]RPF21735.1 MinD-like ATPase involved in chromosome partitioning or flagellar assembly [Myceligenerans xiligouense]
MSTETVRSWPQIEAVVRTDGSGEVRVDGNVYPVVTGSLEEARIEVLRRVTENAVQVGRPVRASAEGPEGVWRLVVHPDGTVVPEEDGPAATGATPVVESEPDPEPGPELDPEPDPELTVPRIPASPPATDAVPDGDTAPPTSAPNGTGPNGTGPNGTAPNGTPSNGAPPNAAPAPVDSLPAPAEPVEPASPPATGPTPSAPAGVADWVREEEAARGRPASSGASEPDVGAVAEPVVRTRREERASFLTQVSVEEPAEQGFRGWLTRMGLPVGPSEAERAERADERDVSQHWPGPRTISIVNGKGGAGKTPSSVLLSAVFAQFGGAGVVAWDNNQTRGTLGWRTEKGPHDATLLDLLPRAEHLLGPSAQAADLARYVHHQTRDRYDVLRSKPMAMANEQRIGQADVDAIHAVLSKYYRLIVIDSGNDESDPMWQRMIDHTDQLVIATTTRDDHAEAGALLLEGLAERDGRSAYLAQQAVAVVSQADQKAPAEEVRKVAAGYESIAREVVTVPFDPGLVDGHLRYGALRPATRRAWLAAGAAVARGL